MNEKKTYVEPTIESIDMSATGNGGSCEPVGPLPPPWMMCDVGPVQIEEDALTIS